MLRFMIGLCVVCVGISSPSAWAAAPPSRAVTRIGAQTIAGPVPSVVLTWKTDPTITSWVLYRRALGVEGSNEWGTPIDVPFEAAATEVRHVDRNVIAGLAYEYRIDKSGTNDGRAYKASTYILVGVNEAPVERRGKLILLIDDRFVDSLRPELARLTQDLVGDGWEVVRHDLEATTRSVRQVKSLIRTEYLADSDQVRAVFLFGHFPVPYSGNISPDGHREEHKGAWPADVFYGDMDDELWTDLDDMTILNKAAPTTAKHANVPGDGKFDPSVIPGDGKVELAVGRVDLAEMPAFGVSETELLRGYLEKNHRYRHRFVDPERRALNIDGFGFGHDGYSNFTPIFGFDKIVYRVAMRWFPSLRDDSYLWAYGGGGGQPTSCLGIGTTKDFAHNRVQSVFHILYGSYFGIWDDRDSLLRAPLASQPSGLASVWGKKYWTMHEMGLGRPIGFSVRRSQSRDVAAFVWNNGIQTALMGDPTLRLFMVASPCNVAAKSDGGAGTVLSWEASPDVVAGYHVYRRTGESGAFTRLTGGDAGTSGFVTDCSFTDPNPPNAPAVYLVRAVKLETVNSGTYYNLSQGMSIRYPVVAHQVAVETVESAQPASSEVIRFPAGAYQTFEAPPNPDAGSDRVCGWTGTGSIPAVGIGTSVQVFVDRDSTIRWRWAANRDATVQVVSPRPGQNFTQPAGVVPLEAIADDPDGLIRKVEFLIGKDLIGEDLDSVYDFVTDGSGTAYRKHGQPALASYRFDWKNVPDGQYSVTARTYDDFGGSTTSAPVEFTVSGKNEPPTVVIDSPKAGAIYKAGSAKFNLQATAEDDGLITKVEYFLGSQNLGLSRAAPYSLYQVLSPGTYTFTAKATDQQGAATTSLPVTITVTAD